MHLPVMPKQVLASWLGSSEGCYLDGTFGGGGHSRLLLERLSTSAQLWVSDCDPEAVDRAQTLAAGDGRVKVLAQRYEHLAQWAAVERHSFDGILLDLGMSSYQLDNAERGFSFLRDGVLDMRFDPSTGAPIWRWLNEADEADIVQVLRSYGEERRAIPIAKSIVKNRTTTPIRRTGQLVELIGQHYPAYSRTHPATRSFQALRIAANRELSGLSDSLSALAECLRPKGHLVVLSFHSLEDRLVKHCFQRLSRPAPVAPELLRSGVMLTVEAPRFAQVLKKAMPEADEIRHNPRSRSAILRVLQRL